MSKQPFLESNYESIVAGPIFPTGAFFALKKEYVGSPIVLKHYVSFDLIGNPEYSRLELYRGAAELPEISSEYNISEWDDQKINVALSSMQSFVERGEDWNLGDWKNFIGDTSPTVVI